MSAKQFMEIASELNAITQKEFISILTPYYNDIDYINGKWLHFQQNQINFCETRNPPEPGMALIEHAIKRTSHSMMSNDSTLGDSAEGVGVKKEEIIEIVENIASLIQGDARKEAIVWARGRIDELFEPKPSVSKQVTEKEV